ncbi:hypothetical protein CEXT_286551 [Caerostris extrusa]|uniref:Uncharacterized protein n=1 Tax=Caerostris extrusa TaxID=172846 RepID=A0AAV4NCM1_CAEEX|nr:hypothetical protein CEXT_286551 [Caerostris extrusa]
MSISVTAVVGEIKMKNPVTARCSYEVIFKCRQSTCILPLKSTADGTLFHTPSSLYVLSRTDRQLILEGLMVPDPVSPSCPYEEIFKCRQITCIPPLKPTAHGTLFHTPSSLYVLSTTDGQLISGKAYGSAPGKC